MCGASVNGQCIHCERVLLGVFEKEEWDKSLLWVCPFCRSHWFEGECGKYHWCGKCQTFHRSVYENGDV